MLRLLLPLLLLASSFSASAAHRTRAPAPAPTAGKIAGVWPDRFDSNMTTANSQPPAAELTVLPMRSRLRYDFPERFQLWEYFDFDGNSEGGELWRNLQTFDYDNSSCYIFNWTFSLVAPTWLQATTHATTNYLLRQPAGILDDDGGGGSGSSSSSCASNEPGNYTRADLFKIRNTQGMTNSWLVADSPIAEPIRLEGPDDFENPTWIAILEFATFQAVDSFDDDIFAIPDVCKEEKSTFYGQRPPEKATSGRRGGSGWRSPAKALYEMMRAPAAAAAAAAAASSS
jgi:hypothetical protein